MQLALKLLRLSHKMALNTGPASTLSCAGTDFTLQFGIAVARFAHERRTFRRNPPQRFLENLFDLSQAFHRTRCLISSSTARSSSERA